MESPTRIRRIAVPFAAVERQNDRDNFVGLSEESLYKSVRNPEVPARQRLATMVAMDGF